LTDASAGAPCSVTISPNPALTGTLGWVMQTAGVYVMACTITP
jgi:hypothetical protein